MKTPEITVIAAGRFEVGESPVWDDRNGRLLWTDIPRGEIRELDVQTGALRQWSFGERVMAGDGPWYVSQVNLVEDTTTAGPVEGISVLTIVDDGGVLRVANHTYFGDL